MALTDGAEQVAWLSGLMDFVFPYLVQFLREYTGKVGLHLSAGVQLRASCSVESILIRLRTCGCA